MRHITARRKSRPRASTVAAALHQEGKAAEKRPIVALVESGGEARAVHMPRLRPRTRARFFVTRADRKSRLHTDESNLYPAVGEEFAKHETVKHSAKEYVRGDVHTNSVEGFFGIFKRGMTGVYHHCGEQHLQRYLDEFASATQPQQARDRGYRSRCDRDARRGREASHLSAGNEAEDAETSR